MSEKLVESEATTILKLGPSLPTTPREQLPRSKRAQQTRPVAVCPLPPKKLLEEFKIYHPRLVD
jgi:hypothetical protein